MMLTLFKPQLLILLTVILGMGGLVYKYYTMSNTIHHYEVLNLTMQSELRDSNARVLSKDNALATLNMTIVELSDKLNIVNEGYSKYKQDYELAKKKLSDWEQAPIEVRYKYIYKQINPKKTDLSTATCVEGIELNKRIAKIKYEDL